MKDIDRTGIRKLSSEERFNKDGKKREIDSKQKSKSRRMERSRGFRRKLLEMIKKDLIMVGV